MTSLQNKIKGKINFLYISLRILKLKIKKCARHHMSLNNFVIEIVADKKFSTLIIVIIINLMFYFTKSLKTT